MLPAEGVKIPNSSMVKLEGGEQICLSAIVGSAEERANMATARTARATMVADGEECLTVVKGIEG